MKVDFKVQIVCSIIPCTLWNGDISHRVRKKQQEHLDFCKGIILTFQQCICLCALFLPLCQLLLKPKQACIYSRSGRKINVEPSFSFTHSPCSPICGTICHYHMLLSHLSISLPLSHAGRSYEAPLFMVISQRHQWWRHSGFPYILALGRRPRVPERKLFHLPLYLIHVPEIRGELSYWANSLRYKLRLKGFSNKTQGKTDRMLMFLFLLMKGWAHPHHRHVSSAALRLTHSAINPDTRLPALLKCKKWNPFIKSAGDADCPLSNHLLTFYCLLVWLKGAINLPQWNISVITIRTTVSKLTHVWLNVN